jgi:hypothetical protein
MEECGSFINNTFVTLCRHVSQDVHNRSYTYLHFRKVIHRVIAIRMSRIIIVKVFFYLSVYIRVASC